MFLDDDAFNRRSMGRSSLMETSVKIQLDAGMRVLTRKVFHEEIVLLFTVASGNIKVRLHLHIFLLFLSSLLLPHWITLDS